MPAECEGRMTKSPIVSSALGALNMAGASSGRLSRRTGGEPCSKS